MFACAMYPFHHEFLESVKEEATANVIRLRNHPCIALWCGNNENDEGWHNWGWQKQFGINSEDSALIYDGYLQLFENLLPQIVEEYAGPVPYWPSSPSTGWGRPEAYTSGDVHYWGVWWGFRPFETYITHTGRFVSEYGFQGFPQLATLLEANISMNRGT
jgi:beta-mannosidase